MAKKKSTQIYKLMLLFVSALGFLALVFTAYKYSIGNNSTSFSFIDFIGNISEDRAVDLSARSTVYSIFEITSLVALVCLGANVVLALLSFVLEGLSVKLMKLVSIVGTLVAIASLICGYIYLGGINPIVGSYSLGFASWFILIVSALHTITVFYTFKK